MTSSSPSQNKAAQSKSATSQPAGIDPRGPRFGACVMSILLATVLLAGQSTAALVLLGLVVALFVVGAVRGAQGSVQGIIFAKFIRPRLAPSTEREDPRPPRFAQGVGLVVTGVGFALGLAGVTIAVPIAALIALVAAFLNAAFDYCLGCEMYLLLRRLAPARS